MGKLEILEMMKLGSPDDLMGKLGALDHYFYSKSLKRLHYGPQIVIEKFWMSCKLKKNKWDPNYLLFLFSKIAWWLPMFDFVIFCHLLRLMGIYREGAPVRIFEKFRSLFSPFSFFFSFMFFIFHFFLSLSFRGPFSSGAPGLCPPMPPSHYATD